MFVRAVCVCGPGSGVMSHTYTWGGITGKYAAASSWKGGGGYVHRKGKSECRKERDRTEIMNRVLRKEMNKS